jgi:hypothetical protein
MNASNWLKSLAVASMLGAVSNAQTVNSGSDGHDGAFNPTQNVIIDMANHPDGIYHYTSVNIPSGVTVSFIPNAGNKPVVWLVQGNCSIAGNVSLDASEKSGVPGGKCGPGGWNGGNAALDGASLPGTGLGPGGGTIGTHLSYNGGNASYATVGACNTDAATDGPQFSPGEVYGNKFCLPLIGGSGGGGGRDVGGGGGGGALLIAASGTVTIHGQITAKGGRGYYDIPGWGFSGFGGAGSGGSIRIVATTISGSGGLNAVGGSALNDIWSNYPYGAGFTFNAAGLGRIRLDGLSIIFNGSTIGEKTTGFQPIIIPIGNQNIQVAIHSVGGVVVAANPSGVLANPDIIVPAQQINPMPVVVSCTNVPLNSEITVVVQPANGTAIQAVGMNNAGTLAASAATVSLNMPRGGGIIYAKCVSGIAGLGADTSLKELRTKSLADTGWTSDGERFAKMEITASLGGKQQIAYLTESGKRYAIP